MSKLMIIATIVIALASVINLGVAIFMWRVMKGSLALNTKIFESSHRPFVAIVDIPMSLNVEIRKLDVVVVLDNTGSIPAKNLTTEWEIRLGGSPIPMTTIPAKASMLFPNSKSTLSCSIGQDVLGDVLNGKIILDFSLKIKYQGVTDNDYETYHVCRYDKNIKKFISIESKWA